MASNQEFVDYVVDQIRKAGQIEYKKMFGEYGIYCDTKFVGLICDNQFLLKPTKGAKALLGEVEEVPPYPGAKPAFLIENLDNSDFVSDVVRATYEELPFPKPKKPKKAKAEK